MPSSSVVSRPLWSSRLFTLYPDLSFPRLLLFFLIVNLNQSNVLRKLVSKKIFQSYNCESKESLRSARCLGRAGKYLISCPVLWSLLYRNKGSVLLYLTSDAALSQCEIAPLLGPQSRWRQMGDVFSPSYKIKRRGQWRDRDGDDSRIKIINQTIHCCTK